MQNLPTVTSCQACGAALDVKNLVSDSGWREAPRRRDLTEIHFGKGSTCQLEGEIVPVVDVSLAARESVYFEHHVLLWKEEAVRLDVLPLNNSLKRWLAGMPLVITTATGPGRVAFSRDATGELLIMLLHPGMRIDVREHAFVLASGQIDYSYVRIKGLRNILFGGQGMFMDQFVTTTSEGTHYPVGRFMDRFRATTEHGLLLLHGRGNVFVRRLDGGQSVLVKPPALIYKDTGVTMSIFIEHPGGFNNIWRRRYVWLKLAGRGRVAIQSEFRHWEDPAAPVRRMSLGSRIIDW
jgi:uncharacterized protein (AIM24 family)